MHPVYVIVNLKSHPRGKSIQEKKDFRHGYTYIVASAVEVRQFRIKTSTFNLLLRLIMTDLLMISVFLFFLRLSAQIHIRHL